MSLPDRNAQARHILAELEKRGVRLYLDETGTIRAKGNAAQYLGELKIWRAQLIEILSPKCAVCGGALEFWNGWYCRMGCGEQKI